MLDFDAESAVTDEGVNAKSALIGVAVCGGSLVDAESAVTDRVVNAKNAVIAMVVGLPSVGYVHGLRATMVWRVLSRRVHQSGVPVLCMGLRGTLERRVLDPI